MSRTYLLYIELNNLSNDQIYEFFIYWCGYSQIFKINTDDDYGSFAYVEMGCSGGIHPSDTMSSLKKQLEKKGAKEIHLKCWDIHQDKIECEL